MIYLWPDLDFEELSSSRQSIEERLIEEYRNSSYSSDTRAELERIIQDKECISRPKSRIITYNSSFFHQLHWVLKRTFQNLMLNPQTSVAQVYILITLLKYDIYHEIDCHELRVISFKDICWLNHNGWLDTLITSTQSASLSYGCLVSLFLVLISISSSVQFPVFVTTHELD